jgi:hypothetical protein
MKRYLIATAMTAATLFTGIAHSGALILAGTDADDHGSSTATANVSGWLFMQRSLENLAPAVTNGNRVVTILGSISDAAAASNSAFNFSSLNVGCGASCWTINTVSTANFGTFFSTGGALSNTGILMMDSGENIWGGVSGSLFTPYASKIDSFLGAGGGLFSQANGYEWLSALIPGLTVTGDFGDQGLAMTAAGNTAFPGLTNADLSSGPWHNAFRNVGGIPILAKSTSNGSFGEAVIIGASAGSITAPSNLTAPSNPVPAPASLALMAIGLAVFRLATKGRRA